MRKLGQVIRSRAPPHGRAVLFFCSTRTCCHVGQGPEDGPCLHKDSKTLTPAVCMIHLRTHASMPALPRAQVHMACHRLHVCTQNTCNQVLGSLALMHTHTHTHRPAHTHTHTCSLPGVIPMSIERTSYLKGGRLLPNLMRRACHPVRSMHEQHTTMRGCCLCCKTVLSTSLSRL